MVERLHLRPVQHRKLMVLEQALQPVLQSVLGDMGIPPMEILWFL